MSASPAVFPRSSANPALSRRRKGYRVMAEPVILLAVVMVMRMVSLLASSGMAVARERARANGLAAALRAVRPYATVVSRRPDGEILIISPRSPGAAR
jgi:hypothetical protein